MNDHRAKPPIVLVVDDEPRNLQLLGSLLYDELGCDLCFATSGREALDSVAGVTPDLVLLDVNMPDMNGYQVCAAFHETDGCREIPVIFITAPGGTGLILSGGLKPEVPITSSNPSRGGSFWQGFGCIWN